MKKIASLTAVPFTSTTRKNQVARFIFKFGGASVKDAPSIINVASIVARFAENNELVVVVSAMAKTTNALEVIYDKAYQLEPYLPELKELEKFHLAIFDELFPEGSTSHKKLVRSLQQLKVTLENVMEFGSYDEGYDGVISFGEILSSQILAAYIQTVVKAIWIDARNYISTDATFREGKVDFKITNPVISQEVGPLLENNVVVTQGFIGSSPDSKTTTLGREGSDFSASIFAAALDADELTIWKDVAGVLTADPKRMPDAELFPHLSYFDAAEMTYYGASVIHPKTIRPLALAEIPLRVRSFLDADKLGTLIGPHIKDKLLPAYIFKDNQILLSISSKDLAFITEHELITVLETAMRLNIKINLMQNSAISLSIIFDNDKRKVQRLLNRLAPQFTIQFNEQLELVTIKSYTQEAIAKIITGRKRYLEQITRSNYQVVLAPKD